MKIPFNQWVNSMSFMLDDEFDNNFMNSIENLSGLITESANGFNTPEGLTEFLLNNDHGIAPVTRLKSLVSLIGLSEERLKRVVSLVRFRLLNNEFTSEWSIKAISKKFIDDVAFRTLLVNFFVNGRDSEIGVHIPLYYMANFKLTDNDFINNLRDRSYVERILNDNEIQDKYSNRVGSHVESLITNKIDIYIQANNSALRYETQKEFPLLNKNIDIIIPNVENARVLIEASYNITTGSGQSKRADQLSNFYADLMRHNVNHRNAQIKMINYCDGFGWVGRQADLRRIYDSSDYVINQSTLHLLDEILESIFE
ncbi:hypothetical protein GGR22_001634 [Flavobacterium gossypii]|uniref:BanI/HgiCI C-terminal domain-containing protein n=1 Tax=Flavobacterium gossypii TaxID=1646119 RepID=A0ABR6DQ09_9FLAO|nr:DpnII family type II restriction endonuclease [Flavobacterium gossypii]MBA9073508.1 hypothetical protein [Flavobacterium gossypii]